MELLLRLPLRPPRSDPVPGVLEPRGPHWTSVGRVGHDAAAGDVVQSVEVYPHASKKKCLRAYATLLGLGMAK